MNEKLTKTQAWPKIKYYCAYQERCHKDVKDKLISMGIYYEENDELQARLIEEGYLNEERFATQFAGGKFRIKHWGKLKITYELKQKMVSAYCIKKALLAIDLDDYEKTLQKYFDKKKEELKTEKNIFIKKTKIRAFLKQKGFEDILIYDLLKAI